MIVLRTLNHTRHRKYSFSKEANMSSRNRFHIHIKVLWLWIESYEIMTFQITVAKKLLIINTLHEWERSLWFQCVVFILWVLIIFFVAMWNVVSIIMECDLAYEGFLPFQNIHVDIHKDQFSKIVSGALIWSQQDNPRGHLTDLSR
jgi:hypothetical protein